jgi:hypothetical protein
LISNIQSQPKKKLDERIVKYWHLKPRILLHQFKNRLPLGGELSLNSLHLKIDSLQRSEGCYFLSDSVTYHHCPTEPHPPTIQPVSLVRKLEIFGDTPILTPIKISFLCMTNALDSHSNSSQEL